MWKTLGIIGLILLTPAVSQAAGGITHMYVAVKTIPQIPDKRLRDLLLDHMDAYLVGSNYPDTGYVTGAHYGEDSHWEPFLNAFADDIRAHYLDPADQNPALVAFLMGCATHSVSDRIYHAEFLTMEALLDFGGNWNAAHDMVDTGLDYIINMEKSQWLVRPTFWWVPVDELVRVYQKMGKSYPANEIRWGNAAYSLAGIGERIADPFTYYFYKTKIPWAAHNYEQTPIGGMQRLEQAAVPLMISLWQKIQGKDSIANIVTHEGES